MAVGAALAIPIGGIVGIVLAILLLFLLCGLCAYCYFCGAWGKGGRRRGAPRWVVSGNGIGGEGEDGGGRGGIIADDDDQDVDYGRTYKEAAKYQPNIPVVHEVLVKGGSLEDKLNYDSNISLGLLHLSGGQKAAAGVRAEAVAEGLESLLAAKGYNSSSSGSESSSSNSSGKAKKNKKVRHKGDVESTEVVELLVEQGSSSSVAKYDNTIVYNGHYYEEEDFERHLASQKGGRRLGKRLKDKWNNNMLGGIQEGEQDDRPSEHVPSSSSSSSDRLEQLAAAEYEDNAKGRIYQNAAFFDWKSGQGR